MHSPLDSIARSHTFWAYMHAPVHRRTCIQHICMHTRSHAPSIPQQKPTAAFGVYLFLLLFLCFLLSECIFFYLKSGSSGCAGALRTRVGHPDIRMSLRMRSAVSFDLKAVFFLLSTSFKNLLFSCPVTAQSGLKVRMVLIFVLSYFWKKKCSALSYFVFKKSISGLIELKFSGNTPWLSFRSFLTFLHQEVERHFLWKFYKNSKEKLVKYATEVVRLH